MTPSPGVGAALHEALTASPRPEEVDVAQLAPFDWDRVVVFGPYATQVAIDDTLGFAWPSSEAKDIEGSDLANLVVFLRKGEVVATEMVPRSLVNFSSGQLPMDLDHESSVLTLDWNGGTPVVVN